MTRVFKEWSDDELDVLLKIVTEISQSKRPHSISGFLDLLDRLHGFLERISEDSIENLKEMILDEFFVRNK